MFQKSIEAIIAQGVKDLDAVVNRTRQAADDAKIKVSKCQSEIQTLVNLAKNVPEKVFDRYSQVFVSTMELYNEEPMSQGYVTINNCQGHLHGMMGDERLRKGRYRLIVLMEPIS